MSMYEIPELARILVKERYEEAVRIGHEARYAQPSTRNRRSFFGLHFSLRQNRQTAPCAC